MTFAIKGGVGGWGVQRLMQKVMNYFHFFWIPSLRTRFGECRTNLIESKSCWGEAMHIAHCTIAKYLNIKIPLEMEVAPRYNC